MAKQNAVTALVKKTEQDVAVVTHMADILSPKAKTIFAVKQEKKAKVSFMLESFVRKRNKLKKKIEAMDEWVLMKDIEKEIQRLKKEEKKLAESAQVTAEDDLYEVEGETIVDKLETIAKKRGVR